MSNWIADEKKSKTTGGEGVKTGDVDDVNNTDAPRLGVVQREPARKQKPLYMQAKHIAAFELLAFEQKGTKKAPELAEEAIELLMAKYGKQFENEVNK